MYDDSVESVPLVTKSNWPGLSIRQYMPFTIKDNKLYMFDWDGKPCGGPYIDVMKIMEYFGVTEENGKKYIVDLNGKLYIDDVDEYDIQIYTDGFDEIVSIYGLYSKNGKWGFFTLRGDVSQAIYDSIDDVQYTENCSYRAVIRIDEKWGWTTPGVDFEPFPDRAVKYNNEICDVDLPI